MRLYYVLLLFFCCVRLRAPVITGPVDPARDIDTLNEDDLESEFMVDSEYEGSEQQSLAFDAHNTSLPVLNVLDGGGEDYRFSTGKKRVEERNRTSGD